MQGELSKYPLTFEHNHVRMSCLNVQQPSCDHEEHTKTISGTPSQSLTWLKHSINPVTANLLTSLYVVNYIILSFKSLSVMSPNSSAQTAPLVKLPVFMP